MFSCIFFRRANISIQLLGTLKFAVFAVLYCFSFLVCLCDLILSGPHALFGLRLASKSNILLHIIMSNVLQSGRNVCGGRSCTATRFHTILRCFRTILLRLCLANFQTCCYFNSQNNPFYRFLLMSELINWKAGI